MAFRRTKSDARHETQGWQVWADRHRAELAAMGLPAEVYLDRGRWNDFLENGHLHWHESSGFEFRDLSSGQIAALYRFLEREYGTVETCPPLLRGLRVRFGSA
jgi:hypothetical protein